MNNIFVVTAHWADYEWQKDYLVGVYTSKGKAWEAQKAYEDGIERIKNLKNPLTEEEQEMDYLDLSDDKFDIWYDWSSQVSHVDNFSNIIIQEIQLDSNPILYGTN